MRFKKINNIDVYRSTSEREYYEYDQKFTPLRQRDSELKYKLQDDCHYLANTSDFQIICFNFEKIIRAPLLGLLLHFDTDWQKLCIITDESSIRVFSWENTVRNQSLFFMCILWLLWRKINQRLLMSLRCKPFN